MNKKTAITIVITVVLAEISKMLMNTTRWEEMDEVVRILKEV